MNADDPKFTAHALGELEDLSPAERAEIEALISSDPASATAAEETRALAARLRVELQDEAAPALEEKQRAAVLQAAQTAGATKKVIRFSRPARVLAAIAACLAVGVSAALLFPGFVGRRTEQHSQFTMRESAEPSPEKLSDPGGLPKSAKVDASTAQPAPGAAPIGQAATADGGNRYAGTQVAGAGAVRSPEVKEDSVSVAEKDISLRRSAEGSATRGQVSGDDAKDGLEQSEARSKAPATRPESAGSALSLDDSAGSPFVAVRDFPVSTVSVYPGSASFGIVRRFLKENQRPPPASVRIEELLNYFASANPEPKGDATFTTSMEVASCPWAPEHRLVRIGVKGRETTREVKMQVEFNPAEASGYRLIGYEQRTPVRTEVGEQPRNDGATRDGRAWTVLYEVVPAKQEGRLYASVDASELKGQLGGGVGGAGEAKLEPAPQGQGHESATARAPRVPAGPPEIPQSPAAPAVSKDAPSKAIPIPHLQTARAPRPDQPQLLPDSAPAEPANPAPAPLDAHGGLLPPHVPSPLPPVEQNPPPDDAKAYFVGKASRKADVTRGVPGLEPRVTTATAGALTAPQSAVRPELLMLRLSYKTTGAGTEQHVELPLTDNGAAWEQSSPDFRFAAAVAGFGMLLQDSPLRGQATWESVIEWARQGLGPDPDANRKEFLGLVEKASGLSR